MNKGTRSTDEFKREDVGHADILRPIINVM